MLVKNLRQPEGFKSSRPPSVLIICSYTCSCFPMPKATHPPVRTPSSPILAPQNHAAYFCICCCSAWNHLIWGPNYSFPPALNPSCKLSGNLRNLGIRLYQITFLILLIFFFPFLVMPCCMWDLTPQSGIKPMPLQQKHGVLITGSQGKSLLQFSAASSSCPTLCDLMDRSMPSLPVRHQLPELAETHVIELVITSNHLLLCCPLCLPSIFPSIRVLSSESALHIRWPKYWSFRFSISPSNEYSGLVSFRMDWLDLLAVQGTLKSLLQQHCSKASILWQSAFFMVQLSLEKP